MILALPWPGWHTNPVELIWMDIDDDHIGSKITNSDLVKMDDDHAIFEHGLWDEWRSGRLGCWEKFLEIRQSAKQVRMHLDRVMALRFRRSVLRRQWAAKNRRAA